MDERDGMARQARSERLETGRRRKPARQPDGVWALGRGHLALHRSRDGDRQPTPYGPAAHQTVHDEPNIPFGGCGASGNGGRIGGPANWEEFTQWQWVTIKDS